MNAEDLADTTMNVESRSLAKVQIDSENLTAAIDMFDIFMSDKVEPRRDFIVAHAKEVTRGRLLGRISTAGSAGVDSTSHDRSLRHR